MTMRMRIVLALLVLAFAGRAYAGIVVRSPGDTIIERCEEDFIACMELPSAPKCDEKLMRCVETWANLIPVRTRAAARGGARRGGSFARD